MMKTIQKIGRRYAVLLLMFTLAVGFTSCDDNEEETEWNLPGEWYTDKEIDYGVYTWGRGTVMTFNANFQGTIGALRDPNYLVFRWRWHPDRRNLMELNFYSDGTSAYIEGAEATGRIFRGVWFNSWEDYLDRWDPQPFYMYRQ